MIPLKRLGQSLFSAAVLSFAIGATAAAEDYPSKPIHVVVPYPAGGVADRIARDVSDELQRRLKATVVVENRSGAAGNIGFDHVARQPADGYTLLLAPASNLTIQPSLFKHLSYDLHKDFTPVSLLVETPQLLLVHPSLPIKSVKELVAYSKAHPKTVNFGVSLGAYSHLAGELLAEKTGADFTAIPYQGMGPALNDFLGGQTQFMFNEVMTSEQFVKSGKARALAIAYKTRVSWLPDVPTMAEAGFPNFEVTSWYALVARSGTPKPVIDRLARTIHEIMQSPEIQKRYSESGAFAVGSSPAELGTFIKSQTTKWTAVVKQAGIEPN